jgi:hypothetical protein
MMSATASSDPASVSISTFLEEPGLFSTANLPQYADADGCTFSRPTESRACPKFHGEIVEHGGCR